MLKIFSKKYRFWYQQPSQARVMFVCQAEIWYPAYTTYIKQHITYILKCFLMHLIISSSQSGKALLTQLKRKLVSLRDRCNARGLFTSCCKAVKLSVFFCSQGMSVNDCTRPPGVPCFRVVAPNIPVVFSCPAVQLVFYGVLLPCCVLLPCSMALCRWCSVVFCCPVVFCALHHGTVCRWCRNLIPASVFAQTFQVSIDIAGTEILFKCWFWIWY